MSILGCQCNSGRPGTILGCHSVPQPQHTPWQSITGRHSNSGSPGTIRGAISKGAMFSPITTQDVIVTDSPGTVFNIF